jgi:ribosomal protein S18 acetylase RimI-like enzyme
MARFEHRGLQSSDAADLARLHQRCFGGYFLTQLGHSFLRRYYAEFCRHDVDYGVVAIDRQTRSVVAFVVGTADSPAHFRAFYRRNMHLFVPLVGWRFLTNRTVRGRIWERTAHIKTAMRSLIPGAARDASTTLSDTGPKTQCPLRLLSIAVAPESRGSGVAALLNSAFEDALRSDGHKRVGLSVLTGNGQAIAFYRKVGWELTYETDAACWFEKDL